MTDFEKKINKSRELRARLNLENVPVELRYNSGKPIRLLNSAGTAGRADVPILISKEAQKEWIDNDPDGLFLLQEINLPADGNGLLYGSEFFITFLGHLKNAPIPGSKRGHEISAAVKPPTDLIIAGGEVSGNTVKILNWIPSKGESGDNSILLKEARSGMLYFSLCCYAPDIVRDGRVWVGPPQAQGLRQDVVERPAMVQSVSVA